MADFKILFGNIKRPDNISGNNEVTNKTRTNSNFAPGWFSRAVSGYSQTATQNKPATVSDPRIDTWLAQRHILERFSNVSNETGITSEGRLEYEPYNDNNISDEDFAMMESRQKNGAYDGDEIRYASGLG